MTAPVTGTCGPCGAEGVPVVRTARFSDWSEVWQCYDVESCWDRRPGGKALPGAGSPEPPPAQGPLCDHMDWEGHCPHPTCHKIDDTLPDLTECPTHGAQEVTGGGSFTGYAGGRCYTIDLACGCTVLDEAGDIAAAI